ncbi:MAG: hypothetical protein H6737_18940 [Alphaproteobacteria bacterium]|nr:hypothetical protein [Alphaproteobacteria bacterium]
MRLAKRLGLPTDRLTRRLRSPLTRRLLEGIAAPDPTDALLRALRAERGRRVVVISQVERAGPDVEPVLAALIAAGDVPVVLVGNELTPLLDTVRERHGNAALLELGAPQTPLGALPTDVLQVLVAAAAHQGPIALSALAGLCHRAPHEVLASLQGAVVRGIPVEDDGQSVFTVDPDIVDELRAVTLPTWASQLASEEHTQAPPEPEDLDTARWAVAVGAWPAARRWFASAGPEGRLEHAALAWAMGDLPAARGLLETEPTDVPALLGVLWDLRELDTAATLARGLDGVAGSLDAVALEVERGAVAAARQRLEALLPLTSGAERCTALHLAGVLALREEAPDLLRAHAGIAEAIALQDDPAHEGRLLETQGRLALRLGQPREAAAAYLRALPLLADSGQAVATARATAGLAAAAELDGEAGQVLQWLDRAVRLNRNRPAGLVWCRTTLQSLMERVPVSGRTTSLTDLRRVSLELAALVAQFRQLPSVDPL